MNHSFTLQVSGIDTRGNYEDVLYAAGCRDALIAVIDGVVYLDFDREGPSFAQAVNSATESVEAAGGKVVRVVPPPG
jgi:hypothetical protein